MKQNHWSALPFIVNPDIFKAICVVIEYVPCNTFIIPLGRITVKACSIVWKGATWLPSPPDTAVDWTYKLYGLGSTVPVGPVGPIVPVAPVHTIISESNLYFYCHFLI